MSARGLRRWVVPELVLSAAAALTVLGYLAASRAGGSLGFPLDDAWIHQTYARNLAVRGEFAFVPGQPSAGSTAPAWTALLALGYWLGIDYRVWAYGLGALLLAANALLSYRLVLRHWPEARGAAWAAGLFVAAEWHLVWAAASGMETLLFSALALAAFVLDPARRAAWLGVSAGVALLVRPDGLLLAPFAAARVLLDRPRNGPGLVQFTLAFAGVAAAYLAFNSWLSGAPWPNTFYAKQAEYAVLQSEPLVNRLLRVGTSPFVGAQALLVPGLLLLAWQETHRRHWDLVLPLGWLVAMVGSYSLRLPVTYQHARYLIPVVPVVLVLGTMGLARLLQWQSARVVARVLSRAWLAALLMLLAIFSALGAQAYTRDVQIIETEMVAAARWISANTEPQARVAAHDIGALGYFAQRPILDLAGLVSPAVIPFIRDEARLADWLDEADADYLMTFPGWYPKLVQAAKGGLKYQTNAAYSPAAGGENMAIYGWDPLLP